MMVQENDSAPTTPPTCQFLPASAVRQQCVSSVVLTQWYIVSQFAASDPLETMGWGGTGCLNVGTMD